MSRCPWAIKFGVKLHTRCKKPPDHIDNHVGRGLPEFEFQRIEWMAGDRREYMTERDDAHAWEEDAA